MPNNRLRTSGYVHAGDVFHSPIPAGVSLDALGVIAPAYVTLKDGTRIPQWGQPAISIDIRYNPSGDCDGNFTSTKFQEDNNCYNYACAIATNTYAQPGRMHGVPLPRGASGDCVVKAAEADGLCLIGDGSLTYDQ